MQITDKPTRAEVIYRANIASGREAEVRLTMDDPARATLADAWARLTALHGDVDPMSLEIEIREVPAHRSIGRRRAATPAARPSAAEVQLADPI